MNTSEGIQIVLNGTEVPVKRDMGYEDLICEAFPDVTHSATIEWEIDYRDSETGVERELTVGEVLTCRNGMVVDVSYTDKS